MGIKSKLHLIGKCINIEKLLESSANKDAEVDQVSEEDDYSVCEAALKKPEEINPMVRKGLEKQGPPAGIGLKNQEAPVRYRWDHPIFQKTGVFMGPV